MAESDGSSAIKRLNHVGIVVADLEAAKRFVGGVLGLELVDEREIPARQRSTAYFAVGDTQIELIGENDSESRVRTLGAATAVIEHIAFEVDDLPRFVAKLAESGVRLRGGEIARTGTRENAWTDPATSGGVMYQLISEASE